MANPQVLKWLKIAAIDILIVSIAQPLNYIVAITGDRGEWHFFYPCFLLAVLLNIATYGIAWWVSMQIMFKREE